MLIDGYVAEQMKKAMLNSEQEQVKIYDAYKNRGFDEGIKSAVDILVDYIDCQLCPLRKECTGGFYCKQELTKFVKNKI